MSKNRFSSCASRVDTMDDANEADVDKLYIEEDNLSTSDGTIVEFDDAGIFSIANDYTSEDEDILAKDESDL